METKHAVPLVVVIALIGIYGIITMQPLAALLLIAVILGIFFIVRFFNNIQQSLDRIEQRLKAVEKKEEDLLSDLHQISGKRQ
jgi:large-conductance mechanosensitive channel